MAQVDIKRAWPPGARLSTHLLLLPQAPRSVPLTLELTVLSHSWQVEEWLTDRKLQSNRKGVRSLWQQWKVTGQSGPWGPDPRYVHLCRGIRIRI